jgi:hypothetical protein
VVVLGDHGQLLPGDRVEQAGLSRVPPPEESDMDPFGGWCLVHCHKNTPFRNFYALDLYF